MEFIYEILSKCNNSTVDINLEKYYIAQDVIYNMGYKKSSLYSVLSRIPRKYIKKNGQKKK